MRLGIALISVIYALSLNAVPASAQGRGNGHATTKAKSQPTRVAKTDARVAKADTRRVKAETKAARKTSTATKAPMADITPTTPTTRPVRNPKLEARLQRLLPADLTVQNARTGFKNWGQFVAAVHVSNNLGIPFADLKAKMTGITPGTDLRATPMSLGQAIQDLRGATAAPGEGPTRQRSMTSTKIRSEVKKAEDAANADLRQTRARS